MTANIRMPLVNSDKNAQIGKVFADVDTTSEIYQLFESNFNASDRKLPNLQVENGEKAKQTPNS
ncbi:MAG: hypothetical protein HWQ43_15970 [Nostoc sp. JL31]|uniref:hypothetical protein n=1 Tax=Nostoc sp. JL31 TaxID=2815395 RepID=UPI0025FA8802|nr:hypothetical protein [Nostoc sp. JL31]MBN3890586.1 hypothetical protein [Nostoc sp. JL31]